MCEAAAQLDDARFEVVALAEEEAIDAGLELVLERLEEDEHDDGDEDRVQVHRAEPADVRDEDVEDTGERERERGRDEQASRELVEVGEARTRERFREDEEEDDREDGADRRQVHAEERDEVGERERHRERADGREEANAVANGARGALLAAPPERRQRCCEEPEDVEVHASESEGLDRRPRLLERRSCDGEHRDAEDRGDLRQPGAGSARGLERRDRVEEVHRELREQDGEHGRRAVEA